MSCFLLNVNKLKKYILNNSLIFVLMNALGCESFGNNHKICRRRLHFKKKVCVHIDVPIAFRNVCEIFYSSREFIKGINSLVLHCPSPTAHNIAISKVMVFFAGRLKKGNKGLLYSPSGFNSDCDHG